MHPISLAQVVAACRQFGIPTSQFGREAINDPCLVRDLRRGRMLRPRTGERIAAYIARLGGSLLPGAPVEPRAATRLHSEARIYEHRRMMRQGSARLLAAILAAKGEC